jgi:putative transposase
MTDLYKNKYRIPPARLQTWNYADPGMYFVTICTKERECYFGEITDGQMHLSELGKIAETEWIKTAELRPDMNLELAEFVVMPNHVHGIILIGNNAHNAPHRDAMLRVCR